MSRKAVNYAQRLLAFAWNLHVTPAHVADWRDRDISPFEAWHQSMGLPVLLSIHADRCRLNISFPRPLSPDFPRVKALRACLNGASPDDPQVAEAWAQERREQYYLRASHAPWTPWGKEGRGLGDGDAGTPAGPWLESARRTAESIRRHGYRRGNHPEGDIKGALLMRGREWCVVVTGGKHRITGLLALGHSAVPIRFFCVPRLVVRREDVDVWPKVLSGEWQRADALRLFDRVMEGSD